jgi:hypothetical protein
MRNSSFEEPCMRIYTEYFPYNPLQKVAYKERFGIITEVGGLNRTVRYKYPIEGDYMEAFGIINSSAAVGLLSPVFILELCR